MRTEVGSGRFRRVKVENQQEIVRSIAVWTENLRDAISASSGLEQAITSTAAQAPAAIEVHIHRLVGSMKYRPLDECLRDFANSLANPTSDFVVTALLVSLKHQTRDIAALLTHLSECARSECDLYMRVWVSRARARTSVRIINSAVLIFSLGLALLNPTYIRPFFTAPGFLVLMLVIISFVAGLMWLHQITTLDTSHRFLHLEEME
jgi:tight adherence protein B